MTQQAEPVQDTRTPPFMMAVRYGFLGWVGQFRHDPTLKIRYSDRVVIKTERGLEIGTPMAAGCAETCPKFVRPEQVETYVRASGEDYLQRGAGEVVRAATAEDLAEQRRIDAQAKDKLAFCSHAAARAGLQMRMVACEHLLGGERIIFYFTAEGRIDFRQLVRELAREYHTRIEMRQIGARDEARIVADFEICGRECCCKNFLKVLRPVNMKMAKLQKATLDPTKVSGRCGRLRCCLRYEQQTYEELDARLPGIGTRVKVEQGVGIIRERQIITQILVLDMGEGRRLAVPLEEIQEVLPPGSDGQAAPLRRPRGLEQPTDDNGDPPASRRRGGPGQDAAASTGEDDAIPATGGCRNGRPEDRPADERRAGRPDEPADGEPTRRSRRDRSRRRSRREGAPGPAAGAASTAEPRDPQRSRPAGSAGSASSADRQDASPVGDDADPADGSPREDASPSAAQPGRSGRRRRRRRRPRGGGSGGNSAGGNGGGGGPSAVS